jgi:hypothetical protein
MTPYRRSHGMAAWTWTADHPRRPTSSRHSWRHSNHPGSQVWLSVAAADLEVYPARNSHPDKISVR